MSLFFLVNNMKIISLKKDKNTILVKLNKKSYKGKTFVILPYAAGSFISKKNEEENYYSLIYKMTDNEIEMFNFASIGELNVAVEQIEKQLLKNEKKYLNGYLKYIAAILLTLLTLSLPLIVFQVWKEYKINNDLLRIRYEMTQKMQNNTQSDNNKAIEQQKMYQLLENYKKSLEQQKNSGGINTPPPSLPLPNAENQNLEKSKDEENKESTNSSQAEPPSVQDQLNSLLENRKK